jgi:hypothetical protein
MLIPFGRLLKPGCKFSVATVPSAPTPKWVFGTCRYVVGSSKICWMSALACLDASSTGLPVRSRSGGAVGPVDRTGHKIEPGPQPYCTTCNHTAGSSETYC